MVADSRPVPDLSVQYAVDLLLSKSLASEHVDQLSKSDLTPGLVNHRDNLGADEAGATQEACPDAAEIALHRFAPKLSRHTKVIVSRLL